MYVVVTIEFKLLGLISCPSISAIEEIFVAVPIGLCWERSRLWFDIDCCYENYLVAKRFCFPCFPCFHFLKLCWSLSAHYLHDECEQEYKKAYLVQIENV